MGRVGLDGAFIEIGRSHLDRNAGSLEQGPPYLALGRQHVGRLRLEEGDEQAGRLGAAGMVAPVQVGRHGDAQRGGHPSTFPDWPRASGERAPP